MQTHLAVGGEVHEVVHAAVAGQQVGRHPRVQRLHAGLQEGLQQGQALAVLDGACCMLADAQLTSRNKHEFTSCFGAGKDMAYT